jgi:hypothetical protein
VIFTDTMVEVVANSTYFFTTMLGPGSSAKHITLYFEYIKGDETSIDLELQWQTIYPWALGKTYAVGERKSDSSISPVLLKNTETGNVMFRVPVPDQVDGLFLVASYVGGTTGTLRMNACWELR